ncbi:remorin 4.1-like [Magnolia sinica]|uniref:remorin 4.1-like n=1 Tax=Magnolia sinica TaxID=86752 RepID=UPI00265A2653|nr:remorin 4.1-like [Magnolia sinica]
MLHDHVAGHGEGTNDDDDVRDIHAVTPPPPPRPPPPPPPMSVLSRRREAWETSSHLSSNLSTTAGFSIGDSTAMSREFGAMVLAGPVTENGSDESNLARIGEEPEEMNPLAIVPDTPQVDHIPSTGHLSGPSTNNSMEEVSMHSVKKEEIESKIMAWQTAKISKVNNKFRREDSIINGWESEEVQKASSWMKKVERKLDEKRAKAQEKMQNKVAKAHQKAEEKRASAESKRGMQVAKILELANVMRVVGRDPSKRSFF